MRPAQLSSLLRMSLQGLWMHKLRSLLTVLGLVFGVASVIVMLAVASGAAEEAQQQIESLGLRNIILRSVKPTGDDIQQQSSYWTLAYGLTFDDLRRIDDTCDAVVLQTPQREFVHEARYLDRRLDARVVGVWPNYAPANGLQMARGRFIEQHDLVHRANVCVLGEDAARRLFRGQDPLGRSVQVAGRHLFRVVGVTRWRAPSAGAGSSLAAQDFNSDIYIPLTTDHARIGTMLSRQERGSYGVEQLELSQITVEVRTRDDVRPVARILEGLLAAHHPNQDFSVTVPLDLLERAQATQRIFSIVLASTAAISLLVGGIGIMNIMLASVSERTGEIGIRRALGARRRDIVLQFMVETTILSLVGALIGVALGLAVPSAITWLSGMNTRLTLWAPLIAVVVALAVGFTFGIYPARRAAMLDPIEALRRL